MDNDFKIIWKEELETQFERTKYCSNYTVLMVGIYKSGFDDSSMDILEAMSPLFICPCDANEDIRGAEFKASALDAVARAWSIYALNRHQNGFEIYEQKLRRFLKFSSEAKKNGWRRSSFADTKRIIKQQLESLKE